MRSAAFPTYMLLRRYVWRGRSKHPLAKVNELFRQGYLVCAIPRDLLAKKQQISEVSHISRHLRELVSRGVVRRVRTGRQNVYVLGTWEDRSRAGDGSFVVEVFFLDQFHGRSDVSRTSRSDVSRTTHYNKEKNREKNIPRVGVFEPVDMTEREDDVLYVEF